MTTVRELFQAKVTEIHETTYAKVLTQLLDKGLSPGEAEEQADQIMLSLYVDGFFT